jgi:rSAM/selenodomain-associated transferase 2
VTRPLGPLDDRGGTAPRLSIIIPVRNDAGALARTLHHLGRLDHPTRIEIIVAASGAEEETHRAVSGRAQLIWPSGSTRAQLMNAGAAQARAPLLLFLHADSVPPVEALELIEAAAGKGRAVFGAFEHRFAERHWVLRVVSAINRLRYRMNRTYYGDQGIFVRASTFRAVGGFADIELFEDLDLSQRLKRVGAPALARGVVVTSGRRFLARGPLRTVAFCTWLVLLRTLRLDTQRYAERWRGPAQRSPGSPWCRAEGTISAGNRPDGRE